MMQVICTDGTVLQCQRFEAIDSGVLLYGESPPAEAGEEEEEPEEDEEAMAFIPLHQLRFVLPEGVQPGAPGEQVPQPTPQPAPTQAPPAGGTPQQGQIPPQQLRGQSSPQQQQQQRGKQPTQTGPGGR